MYVFRNHTVERFFPADYQFSGYGDVSNIPESDGYVWFYQQPVQYDTEKFIAEIVSYGQKLQLALNQIDSSKILIAITMVPMYTTSSVETDWHRVETAIYEYNQNLWQIADNNRNVRVVEFADFTRKYAQNELINWKYYFLSQMLLNPRLANDFKGWWQTRVEAIALKRKKCLVLDLDNTLWGGVVGEDGVDGIKIGGDYPGKAFLYWQEALLQLNQSGIILAICSKNNEQDVWKAFDENPFLKLRKEHFSAWRINWNDKASNLRELAKELNIGLDSMVFVDDNPVERELITSTLPEVEVPCFPQQPYELPAFYNLLVKNYLHVYSLTNEDLTKTEQYRANVQRQCEQKQYTDIDSFLRSLDIHLKIAEANEFTISRIAQMTQKTNQFNLTTKRYTESDIRNILNNCGHIWTLNVSDKFGDSGITGCLILNDNKIDTFLMSCRVLGMGIEFAFVKTILAKLNTPTIEADYFATEKNNQVANFWDKIGLSCAAQEQNHKHYVGRLENCDMVVKDFYTIDFE